MDFIGNFCGHVTLSRALFIAVPYGSLNNICMRPFKSHPASIIPYIHPDVVNSFEYSFLFIVLFNFITIMLIRIVYHRTNTEKTYKYITLLF